ncbi:MAG: hypothetical protein ACT4NX_04520 [Deltaproteobacteria bacterium]
MTMITVAPFEVPAVGDGSEISFAKATKPITYWGIYMDDKYVSYTSTRELAESTKAWMEKWLEGKI